jgi:hypothetical protein
MSEDQKPAGTPVEGAPQAGASGSDIAQKIEAMEKRLAESDRKVTELQNEKHLIERRLEEVYQVRQPQHQQVQADAFEKPLEQVALGNTQEGARQFREQLQREGDLLRHQIQAEQEAKMQYESHVRLRQSEKPIAKELDKQIKMQAIVNFQEAQAARKPITPAQAYDAAMEQIEQSVSRLIPKKEPEVPKGALGERGGSGGAPEITTPKVETSGDTDKDYLTARKERLQRMEGIKK